MKSKRPLGTPRLLGIVWPFIAVVLFQALLGCVSLYMLSAVRSYVGGESLWSKGQKDAIYFLYLYSDTHDPVYYEKYKQAISVPRGDHKLRLAMDESPPNEVAAREGILQGGNSAEDASSIIWFYRYFRHVSYMETAIEKWAIGDAYLVKLDNLAEEMHRAIISGKATATDSQRWEDKIFAINEGIAPSAKAFSDALGEGSRFIWRLLVVINLATALALILLVLKRTHKVLKQSRAFAEALQLEKERAQVTLASIGDGVITTDVKGAIAYMNPAAEQLTQWKAEQAQGVTLAALFKLLDDNDQDEGPGLVERILDGQLNNNREHSRQIQRMDGSTVAVTLVGAPILHAGEVSGAVLVLHDMT